MCFLYYYIRQGETKKILDVFIIRGGSGLVLGGEDWKKHIQTWEILWEYFAHRKTYHIYHESKTVRFFLWNLGAFRQISSILEFWVSLTFFGILLMTKLWGRLEPTTTSTATPSFIGLRLRQVDQGGRFEDA